MAVPVRFDEDDMKQFMLEFRAFDTDGDGVISPREVGQMLKELGEPHDNTAVAKLVAEADINGDGVIDFPEFKAIVAGFRTGRHSQVGNFARIYSMQMDRVQHQGHSGIHSYSHEEMAAFAEHITFVLAHDPELTYLMPISPVGTDLAEKIGDGLLLAKFINCCVPNTIDERVLNKRKKNKPLNLWKIHENLNVVLSAARSIGVQVINIGAEELNHGGDYPHLVLGIIWQLVKINLLNSINLLNNPLIIRLLRDGESIEDLLRLPADQLLLRWLNFHLKNAGSDLRVRNFGSDLMDSEAYTIVLNEISRGATGVDGLDDKSLVSRADRVIRDAESLGVPTFIQPTDITSANTKLNLVFCASIFNTISGLEPIEDESKIYDMLEDDSHLSREERAFRMWMNSLGIPNVYINSIFDDLADGLALLKVIDLIEPGLVDWRFRVEHNPNNRFKKQSNCNYAVELGLKMRFSLVGIGGVDIHDGNKTLILAFVWQLMRYHTIKFLSDLSVRGAGVNEREIIAWANETVADAGRSSTMVNFKDKTLANSHFFLDLMTALEPRYVDWTLVYPGDTEEERLENARYAISVARKFNCTLFLLPEDILEVKPKMMLTFVAAIMTVALQGIDSHEGMEGSDSE